MIDEEFFAMAVAESGDETARYMECPRCGSDHVVKRGRTAEQTAVLVVKQVGASPYKTTWRNYKRTPYLFYDYWVKQAKWDWRARAALPLAMGTVSKAG